MQANKEVQRKFGGTGLGLWLSHKLVTAMNGSINCSSEINKGSTFTVELDVNYKYQDQTSTPSIFKDFTVICLFKKSEEIKGFLTDMGFHVIICKSIDEVIESLKNCKSGNYALLSGIKNIKETRKRAKAEMLSLKYSQIILITSIINNNS